MSKSNTTENDILLMTLVGTDPSWRAGATIYLALYTSSPGEGGSATTNEANYTGYARVAITKATGWTDGGSSFTNSGILSFPQCTGGTNALTYGGLVSTSVGAGQIFYFGALGDALNVANLITPQFAIGAVTVTED